MILVDSSVWVLFFRRRAPLDLEAVVPIDEVVTCLPVVQEVLQGIRDEAPFRVAREAMFALPRVGDPLTTGLVDDAVGLYRAARRAGLTIRSSVDCLIAACALAADVEVVHHDRDFAALARVSGLRQRAIHP
ncbi:MAG: PIN domain-containing protein [Planctomycetota bacterium]